MKTDVITVRIEHNIKEEFSEICEEIGLSQSQAIKIFVKAVINHGGIPFELKTKRPNQTTLNAIKDIESGNTTKADSTAELFKMLEIE